MKHISIYNNILYEIRGHHKLKFLFHKHIFYSNIIVNDIIKFICKACSITKIRQNNLAHLANSL